MKILVTGANGFLANNVIRELNRRGFPVRAMVRPGADLRSLQDTYTTLVFGNITSREDILQAVRGCNAVIHIAADTSHHHTDPGYYYSANVLATEILLETSYTQRVKKFIFVSTANAFGYGSKDNPGNECLPQKYPFTLSGYAISKFQAQQHVLKYATSGRLDAVVVNPTFMIGPWDIKPSSGRMITMMYNKKVIPVPTGGKNFIHVADAAGAICNAIEKGRTGECYLLANENLTYSEFYYKMAAITGKSYIQMKLNGNMLKTLGTIGTLAAKAGFRPELNLINARMLNTGNYYSPVKAISELGLSQTPVDTAIMDALAWFDANGYLN